MAKSYPDVLSQWVKRHPPFRRDKNLAIFLALRHDVGEALNAGFSMKTVWMNMHESGRVEFSYETFVGFVNRIIRRREAGAPAIPEIAQALPNSSHIPDVDRAAPSCSAKTETTLSNGFNFDASPKKEDLL